MDTSTMVEENGERKYNPLEEENENDQIDETNNNQPQTITITSSVLQNATNSNNRIAIVSLLPNNRAANNRIINATQASLTEEEILPTSSSTVPTSTHHLLTTATNIVQLTLPNNSDQGQVQSVIQPTQQSVIQTAANLQPVLTKGNVILVSGKPNSVIQTAQGSLQTIQVVQTQSDEDDSNCSDDDQSPAAKKHRGLVRRPSYRKILNDLGGHEISVCKVESSSECDDSNLDSEISSHSLTTTTNSYHAVIPAGTIQIAAQGDGQTLTMSNATSGGQQILQYAQSQDGQFYVPVVTQTSNLSCGSMSVDEDQARKREMRLMKNREAARECRRKKKEYIKCLENRVAVLETQNKALIDELKTLKELYCQQKVD